jgi:hypothetical protein
MLFDRPRVYGGLVIVATLMAIASTISLVR